ncbi:hypothetical protein HHK36_022731 [Tetracentron sinense]|uniref:N-acetyltransferase domain-containing protein n=1 Tax=Tetracentron sinense TaxID=13715 RepID=A0A835D9W8_TETSI|nr:hypothetical protein HHK36_033275 [Tetracentron sinense]KAF8392389.1 hypothetical protein HHK36_022731 [Tetracentron sinense]
MERISSKSDGKEIEEGSSEISLRRFDPSDVDDFMVCRGELECAIATKYWGQRIATQALKMVVSSIFSEWPYLQRLEAVVYVENPGCQRVLEKVGFQREGVLSKFLIKKGRAVAVDVVMFSLLSTHSKL